MALDVALDVTQDEWLPLVITLSERVPTAEEGNIDDICHVRQYMAGAPDEQICKSASKLLATLF